MMYDKREVIRLLEEKKYADIYGIAEKDAGRMFRSLISIAYNKEELVCWRAIEVMGIIAGKIAETRPEVTRNLARRLLWMMREESGNNPWSAPEMLGEIIRNSPEGLSDLVPVIGSFHEEDILRQGVLRAIFRIGEVRPELIKFSEPIIALYLKDEDPVTRAYAILITGMLKLNKYVDIIRSFVNDESPVKIYKDSYLRVFTTGEIARQTVIILSEREN
ncbi:MAG: DVU0298 family protein [Nitrospirota bacterium]